MKIAVNTFTPNPHYDGDDRHDECCPAGNRYRIHCLPPFSLLISANNSSRVAWRRYTNVCPCCDSR